MRAHTGATNAQIPAADWYRALAAYEQPNNTPILQTIAPLTIRRSLRSLSLNLWDEANHKLVSFRSLKHAQPQRELQR